MTTIYHVCRGDWDGRDLLPFASRYEWSDDACEMILAAWPDLITADKAWEYYCTDGRQVHCHATLEQARDFADEYGGAVLEIDATGLDIAEGREYPHPVVCGPIPACRIKVI